MTEAVKSASSRPSRADDELAIRRTLARLARAQDDADREAYLSCFTDQVLLRESVVIPGWTGGTLSKEDLADRYFAAVDGVEVAQHLVSNHLIDVAGDGARCQADLLATTVRAGDDGSDRISQVLARYDLRLQRAGARWLIAERSVHERNAASWTTTR